MASRNNLVAYDPAVAREAARAELRSKVVPKVLDCNKPGAAPITLSAEAQERQRAAMAAELDKIKRRMDERRRRDPTFKETAVDFDRSKMLPFSKFRDYYAELGVEQYCPPSELKDAYKKASLRLHPDKMVSRPAQERLEAESELHRIKDAFAVLSEPATRQAYDKARDRLEAQYEAGVVVTDEATKPPPSCIDVPLTLEEMFCGCLKYQRYMRDMFVGTKWERREDDVFSLKVRPGETPGATFWFKEKGAVSTAGKSDLVFVTQQMPHDVYERIGVDLWYRHEAPTPARSLLFAALVPTLELDRNWQGPVKRAEGNYGQRVAVGNCLAAALGFDRSGWGEALVHGKGVPLLAAGEDARRGRGEVDDKEQELQYGKAHVAKTVAVLAKEEAEAYQSAERGDLVVKFRISPPERPLRAALPPGSFFQPPLALLTSVGDGTGERTLPARPLSALLKNTLLPAVVGTLAERRIAAARAAAAAAAPPPPPSAAALAAVGFAPEAAAEAVAASQRESARRPPPPLPPASVALSGVLLVVGGEAGSELVAPSACAEQAVSAWRRMLPQMRWRTVHAVGDTEMPLLPDEEEEVEAAAVVIIEAVHAARTAPPATVFDARVGKLVPQPREHVLYDPPPGGEVDSDGDGGAKEYRVVHAPGVRCRADPSSEAAVTGVLRAGAVVSGSAAGPKGGWVQLSDGRGYARLHGTSGPLLSVAASSSVAAAAEAESEEDEVVREEKKVAWARAEREYLDGGVAAARALLAHDALRALYRCHCAGGVVIALDHACPLLGRAGNEADAETAACTKWPRLLPYIVGLPPVKPPAARHRVSWRRLRGAAARSAGQDCSLGFCAIGLPPGTAAAVHPARGAALWPALGSAAPHKIGQLEAREREARVTAAQRARKVERERTKALGQLEEAFRQAALPWPPAEADGSGPQLDYAGVLRGQCLDTVGCSGYLPATHLAHAPSLAMLCVRCGCECSRHEVLRAPECPPANGAAE